MATLNGKPTGSIKAFVCKVREIEHHNVVSFGIFKHEYPDKHP